MRLAPVTLGPRPEVGHVRRAPHQRRSGLGSRQRWRSRGVFDADNVFLTRNTE